VRDVFLEAKLKFLLYNARMAGQKARIR